MYIPTLPAFMETNFSFLRVNVLKKQILPVAVIICCPREKYTDRNYISIPLNYRSEKTTVLFTEIERVLYFRGGESCFGFFVVMVFLRFRNRYAPATVMVIVTAMATTRTVGKSTISK